MSGAAPQPTVVILSGPIGSGKTTIAAALKSLWPGPLVAIDGERFLPLIVNPRPAERHADARMLMRAMIAASGPIARAGYDVLIDYAIPPPFIKIASGILKETPIDYVVLLPSLAVCVERLAKRSNGKMQAYNPELYGAFGGAPQHTVSEETAEPGPLAQQIRDGLATGRFRVG